MHVRIDVIVTMERQRDRSDRLPVTRGFDIGSICSQIVGGGTPMPLPRI
jgi:hypothetical protein